MQRSLLRTGTSILVFLCLSLSPAPAWAQASLAGVVRDESGAVLPGVSVEAASPALIEGARNVVTDEQGRYRIEALRPGQYTLTFTLSGFAKLTRTGVEVPSDLVVTINADMKLGTLTESLTVSGQSPQVDVLQASKTQVLTRDVIDALPVSRNVMSIGVLAAGVRAGTPDIGGSRMTEQVALRAHGLGGNDAEQLVEGMSIQSLEGPSQSYFDDMLQSEITVMTSAIPADTSGGGIRLNSVLKDGGNIFSGATFLGFSSGSWQSDNVDDELRAAPNSIRSANGIKHIHMFSASFGGPIKRNKLWFLVTARHQSSDELVADVPPQIVAPDGEVINSYLDTYVRGPSLRLTWQASPNHKIAMFASRWWKRKGKDFSAGTDPRAGQFRDPKHAHHFVGNLKWNWTPRPTFLVEAGVSMAAFDWLGGPAAGVLKERGTPAWYTQTRKTDTQRQIHPQCAYDTGCTAWGSLLSQRQDNTRNVFDGRVSHVTGTHNIKVGYTHEIGPDYRMDNAYNGDIQLNYSAGRPSTVTVYNTPLNAPGVVEYDAALFAQDSWTIKQLTLNYGLRVEWFAAGMDEVAASAGRFVPARFFPAQHGLIKWGPDYAPRLSAVYDLFGDGRTALKTSFSKYHRQYDADPFLVYADAGLRQENRNWFDCPLNAAGTACSGVVLPTTNDGVAQDSEIGPSPSGGNFANRSGALPGDLQRQYNLEYTVGVQHQLRPRLAVGGMFIKRSIRNIQMTDRTFINFSDYTPFQVRMPAITDPAVAAVLDPNEMITVYNLSPAKNSVYAQGLIDRSSQQNRSLYTGFEMSFSARLVRNGTLFGSWTAERNLSVFCESDDNPNGPPIADLYTGRAMVVSEGGRFCDQRNFDVPFLNEFKLAGNYSVRYGIDVAAVLQSYPGLERVITWQPAANLFPNGQRTQAQTIVLNKPGSLYTERWNQLDINIKKNFLYGHNKVHTFQLDIFNVFNANAIRTVTDSVGTSLGQVTAILPGRFPRIAYQFKW
jgi:Carboxypeptidase regulatory-like domain